eukprot:scaffold379551_cov34-Prasinocladus_malaysianus.AAC.1
MLSSLYFNRYHTNHTIDDNKYYFTSLSAEIINVIAAVAFDICHGEENDDMSGCQFTSPCLVLSCPLKSSTFISSYMDSSVACRNCRSVMLQDAPHNRNEC